VGKLAKDTFGRAEKKARKSDAIDGNGLLKRLFFEKFINISVSITVRIIGITANGMLISQQSV
jgi:hypothetical protein